MRIAFENEDGELLCMSHNADEVWCGCGNGAVRIFSTVSTKQTRLEAHSDGRVMCVCSTGPSTAFTAAADGTVHFWWVQQSLSKSYLSCVVFPLA
jgi:hypothetical protein